MKGERQRMAYTIATHNGSKVSRQHNLRQRSVTDREAHISRAGRHETWLDINPRDAYKRLFGEAVAAYNNKQKRADRKIQDYYTQIKKSRSQHPVYEMIVSIGSVKNPPPEDVAREIMLKFCKGWKDRNPNLAMIGAYYHADEVGVPHVHVDYVPVAHSYQKGMNIQTGLVKALGEQGFYKSGKETAQIQWQHRENATLEALCKERGFDVIHPQAGKGVKHLEKEEYILNQRLNDLKLINEQLKVATKSLEKSVAHMGLTDNHFPEWVKKNGLLQEKVTISGEKDIQQLKKVFEAASAATHHSSKSSFGNFELLPSALDEAAADVEKLLEDVEKTVSPAADHERRYLMQHTGRLQQRVDQLAKENNSLTSELQKSIAFLKETGLHDVFLQVQQAERQHKPKAQAKEMATFITPEKDLSPKKHFTDHER